MPKERKAAVKPAKLDVWQKRLADSDVAWKAQMTKWTGGSTCTAGTGSFAL